MGTIFAILFVFSTAIMVTFAVVLGFQQWQIDREEIKKESESRASAALERGNGAKIVVEAV